MCFNSGGTRQADWNQLPQFSSHSFHCKSRCECQCCPVTHRRKSVPHKLPIVHPGWKSALINPTSRFLKRDTRSDPNCFRLISISLHLAQNPELIVPLPCFKQSPHWCPTWIFLFKKGLSCVTATRDGTTVVSRCIFLPFPFRLWLNKSSPPSSHPHQRRAWTRGQKCNSQFKPRVRAHSHTHISRSGAQRHSFDKQSTAKLNMMLKDLLFTDA